MRTLVIIVFLQHSDFFLLLLLILTCCQVHCVSESQVLSCSPPISAPGSSFSMCEVAFSRQSGACLSGRPPRCGAAATAADAAVSAIRADAGGASKRTQTARIIHWGNFTIKVPRRRLDVTIFIWKDKRKLWIGPLCASMAGMQVERLCQDRSHLSWRSKGGEKSASWVCSALWMIKKKKHRSVHCIRAIARNIY